jgi:DNA repair exonuclease SbcCD ATPase subunit
MQSSEAQTDEVHLSVENVGGIESTSVTLGAGVSVLTGRNATNRTSFLRALMGALGSDAAALKADADAGRVELRLGEETYTRTFERRNGTVVTDGEPYLDDAMLADRFAFLLESNAARRAVRADEDLRAVLMGPVDTAAIEREIESHRREREELDRRLDELDDVQQRLPDLEARREDIETELEAKREELETTRASLADADIDPSDDDPVTEALTDLRELRSELDDVRFRLEAERESRDALEEERDDVEARLERLAEETSDAGSVGELGAELEALRDERRRVDALVGQLGSVISFNRERLTGEGDQVTAALTAETDGSGSVTDSLVDDQLTCWTCGETVEESQVASTVDHLEDIRDEQLSRRRELDERIDALEAERKSLSDRKQEREDLERERESVDAELETRANTIDDLEAERAALEADIEAREDEVATLESETYDDLLALHREANEAEFEVGRLEEELASVERDISEAEAAVEERDDLLEERGELTDAIADLRTRIEDLERDAVEAFNEHMETVLEMLGYDNVARVWIERIEASGGRSLTTDSRFDLHVVRETRDGAAYEDSVAHLSESEREVVGLVFALAGYLVHEVYEQVPFMVLDSLEAIDAERIATLVDYVADYAPHLVVALLPEDAAALPDGHRRITDI